LEDGAVKNFVFPKGGMRVIDAAGRRAEVEEDLSTEPDRLEN